MVRTVNEKGFAKEPEILSKNSFLKTPEENEKEGVDFINVSFKSEVWLGKELHPNYNKTFKTFAGKTGSVRLFMSLITIPGFPIELLNKRLENEDFAKIPKEKVTLPNFWALVAYATCERVLQDKELRNKLKNNEAYLTSFENYTAPSLFKGRANLTVGVKSVNTRMACHIAILREIIAMIKEDKFTRENISEFIDKCKSFPELDIFEGIPDSVKSIIEQSEEANAAEAKDSVEQSIDVEPSEDSETKSKKKSKAKTEE